LFVFGGISLIAKETTAPIVEVLIAAAGLLSNLVISGLFYGVHILLLSVGDVLIAGLSQWLAYIFFLLTLFHFIPASPLDGGRLVRALLWKATGNYDRVTHIIDWAGRGVGFLFVCGGITLLIVTHQWFVGLVLTFVGWVLQSAAAQSHHQAALREALKSFNARDMMTKECPLITKELNITQLVRDCILITGQRSFVVGDSGKLQGMVTMSNIKQIPKRRWSSTRIGEIMTPASKLKTAYAEQPASSLLEQMDELRVSEMPVVEKDKVIGVVSRESLMRLARTRAELGV
jgi:CBS domain-containing protein